MTAPVSLTPKPSASAEIRASVIAILRDALASAERGEIVEIGMMAKQPDGEWCFDWSGAHDIAGKVGALEMFKWSVIEDSLGDKTAL